MGFSRPPVGICGKTSKDGIPGRKPNGEVLHLPRPFSYRRNPCALNRGRPSQKQTGLSGGRKVSRTGRVEYVFSNTQVKFPIIFSPES